MAGANQCGVLCEWASEPPNRTLLKVASRLWRKSPYRYKGTGIIRFFMDDA